MDWWSRFWVGEDDQWPPGSNQQLYLYQSATSPTSDINRRFQSFNFCQKGCTGIIAAPSLSSKMGQKHIFKWDCILVQQRLLVGLGITLFCSLNALITYCGRREGGQLKLNLHRRWSNQKSWIKSWKIGNLKLASPQMKVGQDALWVITDLNEGSGKCGPSNFPSSSLI